MEVRRPLGDSDELALFERIADDLAEKHFSICPASLPPLVMDALRLKLESLDTTDFYWAHVGRKSSETMNRFVRRNRVHWLSEGESDNERWFQWTACLQEFLNCRLYLGLDSFESHLSRYDPGGFYSRHIDAFRGERNRIISLVTYLNTGWQPGQGGELVLYPGGMEPLRITPESGTVVLFLSEEIAHEVLPTSRTRYGVAGWFRLRSSSSLLDHPGVKR